MQNSDLPPRYIRHGLTVLVQQHLICHITPDADSSTFYEVDPQGAYNLMRAGKAVALVEERFGTGAGQIVSNLLQLGHARVGDLEDAYKFGPKDQSAVDSATEHINGEGLPNGIERGRLSTKPQDKKITSKADLHQTLHQLLENGFITRVHKRTYYTPADKEAEAESEVMLAEFPDGKTTGPKAKERFDRSVNDRKRKWREEEDELSNDVYVSKGGSQAQKRMRMNGTMPNGRSHAEDGPTLQVSADRSFCIMTSANDSLVRVTLFSRSTSQNAKSPCAHGNFKTSQHGILATLQARFTEPSFESLSVSCSDVATI